MPENPGSCYARAVAARNHHAIRARESWRDLAGWGADVIYVGNRDPMEHGDTASRLCDSHSCVCRYRILLGALVAELRDPRGWGDRTKKIALVPSERAHCRCALDPYRR